MKDMKTMKAEMERACRERRRAAVDAHNAHVSLISVIRGLKPKDLLKMHKPRSA